MSSYVGVIKDFLVVLMPAVIAYINYRGNKKTRRDVKMELEKNLKEKDADTAQMLEKINAELESQKQITMWQNSLPQTDKYIEKVGIERYTNVSSLFDLVNKLQPVINREDITAEELGSIKDMLLKIDLPVNDDTLYPFEIPYLFAFKSLLMQIDGMIEDSRQHGST